MLHQRMSHNLHTTPTPVKNINKQTRYESSPTAIYYRVAATGSGSYQYCSLKNFPIFPGARPPWPLTPRPPPFATKTSHTLPTASSLLPTLEGRAR